MEHQVPVEIGRDILERVQTLCCSLPEVSVRIDESLAASRSTAYSFEIRRRSFCLLVARRNASGGAVPLLVLRADPEDREELLSMGGRFFATRAGRGRLGVVLGDDTDWNELRGLITDSYRVLAPKKLAAQLD